MAHVDSARGRRGALAVGRRLDDLGEVVEELHHDDTLGRIERRGEFEHLLVHGPERRAEPLVRAGLARALGVSTAATVKVVGRLVKGGYIERSRHPSDRRALLLGTLPGAHERLREALGPMHRRMLELASSLDPAERVVVVGFLDRLAEIVEAAPNGEGAPSSPH